MRRPHHGLVNVAFRCIRFLARTLDPPPKSAIFSSTSRALQEGRIAIVTDVGRGMRWTRRGCRRTVPTRTAKSCGPDARRWRQGREAIRERRWQKSPVTGESTKQTVKAIAQGRPECFGEPVVTMLVWFFKFPREAAGAASTRLSLRPLLLWARKLLHDSGAIRAAGTRLRVLAV
jgi:hypothetical protein